MPKPYAGAPPFSTPPNEIAVYSLVADVNHRVAAFGYRSAFRSSGGDFRWPEPWSNIQRCELLIDTGFGRDIDKQFRTLLWTVRAINLYSLWRRAADQLWDVGYDPKSLRAILLNRSYVDHVSVLPDFPGMPVWVTQQEHEFIRKSGDMDFCRPYAGIRYEESGFEEGPYLG